MHGFPPTTATPDGKRGGTGAGGRGKKGAAASNARNSNNSSNNGGSNSQADSNVVMGHGPYPDGNVLVLVSFNRGPEYAVLCDELLVWTPLPHAPNQHDSPNPDPSPGAGGGGGGGGSSIVSSQQLMSAAAALCAEVMRLRVMQAAAARVKAALGRCSGAALAGSSWEHWAALGASERPVMEVAARQHHWAMVSREVAGGGGRGVGPRGLALGRGCT